MIRFAILLVLVIVAILLLSRPKPPVRQSVACPECAGTGVVKMVFSGELHTGTCPMCCGSRELFVEERKK